MNPRILRWLALVDVIGIPLLIPLFIWRLQFTAPNSWIIFPAWLMTSFLAHGDTAKTLGWRADNLGPATREAGIAFVIAAVALVVTGLFLGAPDRLPARLISLPRLASYFAFCLLQQVASQSFLNNRLMLLISKRWLSSLLVGVIFATAHWPNPVLVPVTFIAGWAMAWLFTRNRNIIPLAVAQALLGTLVGWTFPAAWHHNLRVGPGYYRPF